MATNWTKLHGLISAPFTPFGRNGAVHFPTIVAQAEAARGILSGVFICGTTGEGISMTTDERCQVAEHWIANRSSDLKVIAHVGHTSIGEARRLACHAEQIGADAVASTAPLGFRPSSVDDLVKYLDHIASAAPSLPFFYYHMPSLNGVHAPMVEFLPKALARIANFAGIKYTHEDLNEFALMLDEFGGECDLIFGRDEMLFHAIQLGAKGAVGSTYNYMAPIYRTMSEHLKHGRLEQALALHLRILRIIRVLIQYGGGIAGGKMIMQILGNDVGQCRSPFASFGEKELLAMRNDLEEAGFFDPVVLGESVALAAKADK